MIRFNNPEKTNVLPNAILFDTDNTLYSYDPANQAAVAAPAHRGVGEVRSGDWILCFQTQEIPVELILTVSVAEAD